MVYSRPLSSNERLYIIGEELAPPFCIQIVIQGQGNLNLSQLTQAITKAQSYTPGSQLQLKGKLHFSRWIDSDSPPPVREITSHNWRGDDFEIRQFLQAPLKNSTCEVLLLQGNPQYIIFRVLHSVMDARGAQIWVNNVFKALRKESLIQLFDDITDRTFAKSLKQKDYRKKYPFNCISPTGPAIGQSKRFQWVRLTLPERIPGLIAQIATHVMHYTNQHSSCPATRFMIPVDLRFHNPQLQTTANLSNPLFLDLVSEQDWPSLYSRMLQELLEKREGVIGQWDDLISYLPIWFLKPALRALSHYLLSKNRFMMTGILSNIGYIDLNHFSCENFQAETCFFLPVNVPITPLTMVIVEMNNHTEIVVSMPEVLGNKGRLKALTTYLTQKLVGSNFLHQRKVVEINQTSRIYSQKKTVIDLFEEQVHQHPQNIALKENHLSFTFFELNQQVNRLANMLNQQHLKSKPIIAIMMKRSIDSIISILAILKIGGSYLPLDPQYPESHLQFLIDDAKVDALITNVQTQSLNVKIINMKQAHSYSNEFISQTQPLDRAYIIYTSGTTGNPKGVQLSHKNLLNYINWAVHFYPIDTQQIYALYTSLSFDLTITSIFSPLVTGQELHIFSDSPIIALKKIIDEQKVTVLKATPSHVRLLNQLNFSSSKIKTLIIGGEQLDNQLAYQISSTVEHQINIYNEYGPTEVTVGCIVHLYNPDQTEAIVPIGTPIQNTKVYVLDKNLKNTHSGELYLAGDGVSMGYFNRPLLNKEKFVLHPATQERMYRTGDKVEWLANHSLIYLGRVDQQIKLKGYRIEPEEIEHVLDKYPGVKQSIVQKQSDQLVAYLLTQDELTKEQMQEYLSSKLPQFMIPQLYIFTKTFPLTTNGKVDLQELTSYLPHSKQITPDSPSIKNHLELEISRIWKQTLNLSNDIPHATFFELGGDSLKLISLIKQVASHMKTTQEDRLFMSLALHYQNLTLSQLLKVVSTL